MNLFEPLKLRGLSLRNRIAVSPMCMYSCVDGVVNDWHLVHLGSRAVGGAGLLIAEASAVSPEGRISPADAGLYRDEHVAAWAPVTAFIRAQGAVPGVQLAHAGRGALEGRWAAVRRARRRVCCMASAARWPRRAAPRRASTSGEWRRGR